MFAVLKTSWVSTALLICELVYKNAKAELCGDRKLGLIKYVMALMNGAPGYRCTIGRFEPGCLQ